MTKDESDRIVARLQGHFDNKEVIEYDRDRPDKFAPGVFWSSYGVIPTNEIAVVAKAHGMTFAAVAGSGLLYPAMIDRIFGMDFMDRDLCNRLADELWKLVEQHLPKP